MKLSLAIVALTLFSQTSFAADVPVKNAEFAAQAKAAAKAIIELSWGPSSPDDYEIAKETYEDDGAHQYGTYLIHTSGTTGEPPSDKISVTTTVVDGAVLKVEVDCKICS